MFTTLKNKSSVIALALVCLVAGLAWIPSRLSQGNICLIPEGFSGPVFIIFGQADGVKPEVENGKRVYRIPKNGILKTKAEADYRLSQGEFYYIDSKGRRTKLEYLFPQGGPSVGGVRTLDDVSNSSDEIFCMVDEMGTENRGRGVIYFRQFLVGKVKDIERLALKRDQITERALRGAKPSRARRQ